MFGDADAERVQRVAIIDAAVARSPFAKFKLFMGGLWMADTVIGDAVADILSGYFARAMCGFGGLFLSWCVSNAGGDWRILWHNCLDPLERFE